MAIAAMAAGAIAAPSPYKAIVTRQNAQGDYSNITIGRATINWGDADPAALLGNALNQQCGPGTQCDQNPWTESHLVCPDTTNCLSCDNMNVQVVADGQWPDDNMRQALIAGLQAAVGQGINDVSTTTCPVGGSAYSAYYPGTTFNSAFQASFVGITVYHNDESLVAQMSATISVSQKDDNWCGSAASSLFGATGTIAGAVGAGPLSAVFGLLSAACGSGT